METNDRIVYNSSIWDLHIHTCKSAKSSGEFQKMGIKEYLDCIEKIFENHNDLNMISFTDHNAINYDVYEKYYKRKIAKRVKLIPGIEIDVFIDGDKDYKHLIVYFNIDLSDLKQLSEKLNNFIQSKITNTNKAIEIGELLNFLIERNIQFVLSPHCFKQEDRGINSTWDCERIKTEPQKYSDQFFCFWETSGASEIARAEKTLKEFNVGKRVSIISFSDSSDSKKLETFLSNPPQYFNCLPNFRGLQLAGVDCRRITNKQYSADNDAEAGNYIKKIKFDKNEIMLSPKLNVIIGGRGSGKSLLLDSLNLNINNSNKVTIINNSRKDYISKFPTITYNGKLKKIKKNMQIDYFDQLYVSKVFDGSNNIKDYFALEFDNIKQPKLNDKILNDFKKFINVTKKEIRKNNISNLVSDFSIINNREKLLNLDSIDEDVKNKATYLEMEDGYARITDELPEEVKNNVDIKKLYIKLWKKINEAINNYNSDIICDNIVVKFKNKYVDYRSIKSERENNKNNIIRKIKEQFEFEKSGYLRKVNIINSYMSIELKSNATSYHNSESNDIPLYNGKIIRFEKCLMRERPFRYFEEVSDKYLLGFKGISKEFIDEFCYKKLKFRSKKNEEDYLKELEKFDLRINESNKILFSMSKKGDFEDMEKFSPGKKSNVLLEYILSKEMDIPLLIDQPEDNIDNSTIYNELSKWIYDAKSKRQLIIVTHDANVAINADAENIIVAEEKGKDEYAYKYGALEYADNINVAAKILDGGIEAVEKRLKKYGNE